jgi:hypothetical protein
MRIGKKIKNFRELRAWADRLLAYIMMGILLLVLIIANGCTLMAPKIETIYVPERDAIMLRQDVKDVEIWAKPADQDPQPGEMDLEEGWF